MNNYKLIFSYNLRKKMEEQGKTHIDLVTDLGIPSATVTSWTSGIRMPKLDRIQDLADYFHCSIFELIEDGETYRMRNEASEIERMYLALDKYGQDIVMTIVRKEYERCNK